MFIGDRRCFTLQASCEGPLTSVIGTTIDAIRAIIAARCGHEDIISCRNVGDGGDDNFSIYGGKCSLSVSNGVDHLISPLLLGSPEGETARDSTPFKCLCSGRFRAEA